MISSASSMSLSAALPTSTILPMGMEKLEELLALTVLYYAGRGGLDEVVERALLLLTIVVEGVLGRELLNEVPESVTLACEPLDLFLERHVGDGPRVPLSSALLHDSHLSSAMRAIARTSCSVASRGSALIHERSKA